MISIAPEGATHVFAKDMELSDYYFTREVGEGKYEFFNDGRWINMPKAVVKLIQVVGMPIMTIAEWNAAHEKQDPCEGCNGCDADMGYGDHDEYDLPPVGATIMYHDDDGSWVMTDVLAHASNGRIITEEPQSGTVVLLDAMDEWRYPQDPATELMYEFCELAQQLEPEVLMTLGWKVSR